MNNTGGIIVGFVDSKSELGQHYAANRERSKLYKEASFFSTSEVIKYLHKAGFAVHSIKQALMPGAEAGTNLRRLWTMGFCGDQGAQAGSLPGILMDLTKEGLAINYPLQAWPAFSGLPADPPLLLPAAYPYRPLPSTKKAPQCIRDALRRACKK
ncbi:MAG: hypothetical protein R6U22_13160 [Desulfohalobiaceae bacterium]